MSERHFRAAARVFVSLFVLTAGYMFWAASAQPPADPWMYLWLVLLSLTAISFVAAVAILLFLLLKLKP